MKIEIPKTLRPFTVYFKTNPPNEKLVIKLDKWNVHYTILFGFQSKKLHIHRTTEIHGSSKKRYKEILTIRHFTIGRILVYCKYNFPFLYQNYFLNNTINLGKLKKYNCVLLPMECNKEEFSGCIVSRKNKIRLAKEFDIPDPERLFLDPDWILECGSKAFMVYRIKNRKLVWQGSIYKKPHRPHARSFYFLSKKNMKLFAKEQAILIYRILQSVRFKGKKRILDDMERSIYEPRINILIK